MTLFCLDWHKLKTLKYITKLIILMSSGRTKHVCILRWTSILSKLEKIYHTHTYIYTAEHVQPRTVPAICEQGRMIGVTHSLDLCFDELQNRTNNSSACTVYCVEGFSFQIKLVYFPLLDNYRRSLRTFGHQMILTVSSLC